MRGDPCFAYFFLFEHIQSCAIGHQQQWRHGVCLRCGTGLIKLEIKITKRLTCVQYFVVPPFTRLLFSYALISTCRGSGYIIQSKLLASVLSHETFKPSECFQHDTAIAFLSFNFFNKLIFFYNQIRGLCWPADGFNIKHCAE